MLGDLGGVRPARRVLELDLVSFLRLLFAGGWFCDFGLRALVAQLTIHKEAFVSLRYVLVQLAVLAHCQEPVHLGANHHRLRCFKGGT